MNTTFYLICILVCLVAMVLALLGQRRTRLKGASVGTGRAFAIVAIVSGLVGIGSVVGLLAFS